MQDYLNEEEDEDKGPYDSDEKVADEVIEDYYNDLYDNDPPYGTILEHPSKFRKTPSFTIRRKKKKRTI
jgi:hypothetical protein